MKKEVLYKDERYFYEIIKNKQYTMIDSYLFLYKKRVGFLSLFLPYKRIGYFKGSRDEVKSIFTLENLLSENIKDNNTKPLIIDCSPEISSLYDQ